MSAEQNPRGVSSAEPNGATDRERELEDALRAMRTLAAVSHEGDPWYAEHEGIDAGAIFAQARAALGEES